MSPIEILAFTAILAVTAAAAANGLLTAAVQDDQEHGGVDEDDLNGAPNGTMLTRAPFDLPTIPRNPAKINFFLYYSKFNMKLKDKIVLNEVRSLYPNFRRYAPVIFLTHGYVSEFDDESEAFVKTVKNAYLEAGYVNIIEVDWKDLEVSSASAPPPVAFLNYFNVEQGSATDTGERIGKMIMFLWREGFIRGPEDVHILGYSLGAHISGVAGRFVKNHKENNNGRLVRRITGLDPAIFFGFKLYPEGGLDTTDAAFVDMVHTNQDALGAYFIRGHVDFYANGGGGWSQYGCLSLTPNPIKFFSEFFIGWCAHARSFRYFAKTILEPVLGTPSESQLFGCRCLVDKLFFLPVPCLSPRNQCKQKTRFGQYVPPTARGRFYLPVDRNLNGISLD